MSKTILLSALSAACFALWACGGAEPVETTTPEDVAETASFPTEFVTSQGSGPAFYLSDDPSAPALGYVSDGVRVRVAGAPSNDRVLVRINGPMKVKAYLDASRLAYYVQRRGKVRGTPTYVGPGDFVRYLGVDGNRTRVEVVPRLGEQVFGPFQGTFPTIGLSIDEPGADAEAPRAGETRTLPAGQEVVVYDRPDGQAIVRLPASDPGVNVTMLRERGEWKGVRLGDGPYIIGYVNVALGGATAPMDVLSESSEVPTRLAAEGDRPLWRVPARTRIKFNDQTVGILGERGWAREMNRYSETNEADVFIAVDNKIALRGMVPIEALEAIPE